MENLVGRVFENIDAHVGMERIVITKEMKYGVLFNIYRIRDDEPIGSGSLSKFMLEKDFIEVEHSSNRGIR